LSPFEYKDSQLYLKDEVYL